MLCWPSVWGGVLGLSKLFGVNFWNIQGKIAPWVSKFHGGSPLIWAMPKFKQFFMCVLPYVPLFYFLQMG